MQRRTWPGNTQGQAPAAAPKADLTSGRKDGLMDDPPRPEALGGQANAEAEQLHPEVAEFVRWFTRWWLTRGLELVAQEDSADRRAA